METCPGRRQPSCVRRVPSRHRSTCSAIGGPWWCCATSCSAGTTHFADFAVDEAIATNTLAERLQRLRDAGIIARVRDPDDGRRWIYVPRRPAIELIPVLVDLMIWGIANTAVDVPPERQAQPSTAMQLIAQFTEEASTRLVD
jgi:DNA-binding HxlR family transcriptional regulator